MRKFWWIFRHEYTRHVLRKRFIVVLLSVPLYLLFLMAMAILSVFLLIDRSPVGYIDYSGIIRTHDLPFETSSLTAVSFISFNSEEEARAAVMDKRIQALYILPADYASTLRAKVLYRKMPNALTDSQFRSLLRYNLLVGQPPQVVRRVIEGTRLEQHATGVDSGLGSGNGLAIAFPLAAGVLLMAAIFTTSGYLMQAVVEEKENRTMEILATSASPGAIMNGKVAALIMVGMTQLAFYVLPPLALIAWIGPVSNLLPASLPPFDPGPTLLMLATVPPTFVLIAALMATVGAAVTEARESQQVMSLFSMIVMSPFLLVFVIMMRPNGTVAQVLSYFPLTASLTLLERAAFGQVPLVQVAISAGVIILAAAGALWLSGRVFRLGMLRYGKRISLAEIARLIFAAPFRSIAAGLRKPLARLRKAPPSPRGAAQPQSELPSLAPAAGTEERRADE